MKVLEFEQMEVLNGGNKKCGYGTIISCGFVGLAFALATGPWGGAIAGSVCKIAALESGYCEK